MDKRNQRAYNVTRNSTRYTRGGVADVYNTRVGWWERLPMPRDPTDLFFDVTTDTERRPDLIAHKVYGEVKYAWVILQYNNIVDVNEELIVDRVLKLPTPSRLNTVLLSNSIGGKIIES